MQPSEGKPSASDMAAATLRVSLLGPPSVEWGGTPLLIARRQVRALLYRLAAEPQPVPREHLYFLFWPDTPESSARRNLTGLLSHLRRVLPTTEMLLTKEEQVWLDSHLVWTDVKAFQRLSANEKHSGRIEALEQAVGLYRGPFLDGFSLLGCPEFEMWCIAERQTWERLYLEALASLIEEQAAKGEYAAAIAFARRYLATDDLAEEIHRRLIELYATSGDRSAALRQYEQCRTILERELGVDPLPETQSAYRAVLDGSPSPGTAPAAEPTWTTLPGLDVPLIGRDGAIGRLTKAFARARAGHGGVVLISGEAGIGKSRLMQEFATRQQGQALVLAGGGYPDAQTIPYQPLVEALRPALGTQPMSPNVQPAWLAEASRLMPELCDLYPSLPAPLPGEPEQARARLFEALCQLTLGLATSSRPVLLCLDDLHWADGTTLAWLTHLGHNLHSSRLLVLGAFQSEEVSAVSGLRHGLARQGILSELRLERLDKGAILQLLRSLGNPVPSDETSARRLYRATGGNPFFLLEMLRAFLESDPETVGRRELEELADPSAADLRDASEQALPLLRTIQAAVDARVERLSAQARQVLEAGAVLGQTFAFDLVHRAAGRGELETVDGLDELVARQLLWERDGKYQFSHEIARAVVYRSLSRQRCRLLHRRAGEALEQLQPGDAAALARHFELAGEPGRAARHALQAGLAAKAVYGHAEARAYFDCALILLEGEAADLRDPEAAAVNRRLRIQALYERGWAFRLLGDMEAHAQDLQEVTRLVELLGDPCTLAHLRWREAYTHRWFCRYAEAREAAEEGLSLSHAVGECTMVTACQDEGLRVNWAAGNCLFEAMCWREIGIAAREMGDYEQAQSALGLALDLYVRMGEAVYAIHTMGNLSTLCWYLGEFEKAMALARQALDRCEQAGLALERRLPLGDLGAASGALGDVDLARECLLESLSITREIADRTQEIFCLGHLGWLCIRQKQPAEALEHLQAGLSLAEQIGSCTEQGWLLCGLAEAHRLGGRFEHAEAHVQRALEMAQTTGRPYEEALALRILARLRKD
jgi:DNA-binding SARP family transcriptional activator